MATPECGWGPADTAGRLILQDPIAASVGLARKMAAYGSHLFFN
jgi:hypothetical protein